MSVTSVSAPFQIFTDIDGDPLEFGYIYVGQANLDPVAFPKAAYWDAAMTISAAQPIRTNSGYPVRSGSPARVYVDGDYSIRVNNKNGTLVYSAPAATERVDSLSVSYDSITAQDVFDSVRPMANYTALRSYTGRATSVRIAQTGLAGFFARDASDATSADNGGTIIVDALGRRWKRLYSEAVNVRWFGAIGDGSSNDTSAIQSAVNFAPDVYIPSGVFICDIVNIHAGTTIHGDGPTSIIKQSSSFSGGSAGSIYANSGSSGAQLDGITIRDIRIEGNNIESPTFSEFKHLVSLNGVKNAIIDRVQFVGFQGDGLYVGSGINSGDERHNSNFIVEDCLFDGVNKENRNGVSVIDCDGLLIQGSVFTRCTKSTMPGPIDIEPDANAFHVIKDIKVSKNKFFDVGGGVGAISVYLPGIIYTTAPCGFIISDNYLETSSSNGFSFNYAVTGGVTELTSNFGIRVHDNVFKDTNCPLAVFNAKDAVVSENSFIGSVKGAIIGYNTGNENVIDTSISKNLFYNCGGSDSGGLVVFKSSRVSIDNNTFKDCGSGVSGASNAIDFNSGSSSYVFIENNVIVSPSGKTLIAVAKETGHTLTPTTNSFIGNVIGSGISVGNFDSTENDIAESSYTPVITGSSVAGSGTYSAQYGRWRRIGKIVFFRVKIAVNSGHTGSGIIQVTLPTYAAASPNNEETTVALSASGVSSTGGQVGLINPALDVNGSGAVRCYYSGTGTTGQMLIPSGAFTLNLTGFYQSL